MSNSIYPPVGFYFKVTIAGAEIGFSEVSGLEHEGDVETVKGGGENAFEIRLPGRMKYNNLVLKRGHIDTDTWEEFIFNFQVESGLFLPIIPIEVQIELLDEHENPVNTWTALNAYPVKWNVSNFNAMESKLVIETIEFVHHGLKVG